MSVGVGMRVFAVGASAVLLCASETPTQKLLAVGLGLVSCALLWLRTSEVDLAKTPREDVTRILDHRKAVLWLLVVLVVPIAIAVAAMWVPA